MANARRLKARVESAIKRAGKDVIAGRVFYDDVSDRLYVSLFKGPRKTEFVLRTLDGTGQEEIDSAVKQALERLEHTPIG
jgi:hypothetical protein